MKFPETQMAKWIIFLFILFLSSCKPTVEEGDTIVNIPNPEGEAITSTTKGWKAFEEKNYTDAVASFKKAIELYDQHADAYNGLGWAYARLDSLEKSINNFNIALGQQPVFIDALAGHSFVDLAMNNYADAIVAVNTVQSNGSTFYAFRHDPNITMNDLLLVKAQSYFMLGNYEAAQELIDRLDPDNNLDSSSASYIEDLSLEIETLWARI